MSGVGGNLASDPPLFSLVGAQGKAQSWGLSDAHGRRGRKPRFRGGAWRGWSSVGPMRRAGTGRQLWCSLGGAGGPFRRFAEHVWHPWSWAPSSHPLPLSWAWGAHVGLRSQGWARSPGLGGSLTTHGSDTVKSWGVAKGRPVCRTDVASSSGRSETRRPGGACLRVGVSPESGFRAWAPRDPRLARSQEPHRLALATGGLGGPRGARGQRPPPTTAGPGSFPRGWGWGDLAADRGLETLPMGAAGPGDPGGKPFVQPWEREVGAPGDAHRSAHCPRGPRAPRGPIHPPRRPCRVIGPPAAGGPPLGRGCLCRSDALKPGAGRE